jgi:hypothetical protein
MSATCAAFIEIAKALGSSGCTYSSLPSPLCQMIKREASPFVPFLYRQWLYQLYRLPQSQKQCICLSKVYCYFMCEKKFLAVRRVGLMTHREYRVDRPFPVTWLGNVWEPTPPPRSMGLSRLFNPRFPGLKVDTFTLSHGSVISSFGSHSSTSTSSTTSSPTASSRLEHRVSVFPFFS